ncbi:MULTISPECIES: hypothetical protein [unclassified Rathayibacter]|uniref:hypothetical protein n=1 Tax=unclassified Rathayibacter TaxID=2609250 RepID=UPI0011B02870|nr:MULTISPECIES: hypothetical protein [unclassified Rathayibacter]
MDRMKRFRSFAASLLIAGIAATGIGLVSTGPAMAAQPPAGYPSTDTFATVSSSTHGSFPIRRGFYDADIERGWGFDKVFHKHNIWSTNAMKKVMASTNSTLQGNGNYNLKAYAGNYDCVDGRCVLREQVELLGIYNPRSYDLYYGWPVGGKMGMQTLYCKQGGEARCADWVTYSINHPGVDNPYSRSSTPAEEGLTADEQAKQAEILASPEIEELKAEIASDVTEVAFDYAPLPEIMFTE